MYTHPTILHPVPVFVSQSVSQWVGVNGESHAVVATHESSGKDPEGGGVYARNTLSESARDSELDQYCKICDKEENSEVNINKHMTA